MKKPNKARGEVALKIGEHDLILCAEMERLEQFEQATGGVNISQLLFDIRSQKASTLKAGVLSLTVAGDADKAWKSQTGILQFPFIMEALMTALCPEVEEKKPEAEAERP
ncbi:hypothetical protein [Flexibacterium corallicola]|uniref:hypothetical protein n=1 Tax=Flexibacterium corallicola TaxID=3037259 RepID=UPI00286EB6DD|nr:hypothetical protein [Pseudovibrio sp. M1P-2-3]